MRGMEEIKEVDVSIEWVAVFNTLPELQKRWFAAVKGLGINKLYTLFMPKPLVGSAGVLSLLVYFRDKVGRKEAHHFSTYLTILVLSSERGWTVSLKTPIIYSCQQVLSTNSAFEINLELSKI